MLMEVEYWVHAISGNLISKPILDGDKLCMDYWPFTEQ